MNTPLKSTHGSILLAVLTLLAWTGPGIARADDHHDAWSHDDKGYWDDRNHHHAFVLHEHHHGYWREQNGARIFINID